MPKTDPEFKFPRTFECCPQCQSHDRLVERYKNMLKAKGELPKEFPPWMVFQAPLIDNERLKQEAVTSLTGKTKIKVIRIFWDVCAVCGTLYCEKFDVVEQEAQLQMQAGPASGFGGFSGRRPDPSRGFPFGQG